MEDKNGQFERLMRIFSNFRNSHLNSIRLHFSKSEFMTLSEIIINAAGFDITKSPVGIGVSMKELSKTLKVSPAMITKTITSLEKNDNVKRLSDEDDRRGVKVCITQIGFDRWREEHRYRCEFMESVFERFGFEKTNQLFDMVEELIQITSEETEKELKQNRKER